jgi:hypothetical protein
MLSRFEDKKVDREWLASNFPVHDGLSGRHQRRTVRALIAEGRFEEAYRTARDPNPHGQHLRQCVRASLRNGLPPRRHRQADSIRALKRFLTERYGPESRRPLEIRRKAGRRNAVSGCHRGKRPGGTFGGTRSRR